MSIDSLYSKKVMEHFLHPENMGEIKDPSGIGRVGNPVCGDVMELYLKIENRKKCLTGGSAKIGKHEKYITDAKFKTFGCGAAIASSSMMTKMIKGKSLKEASKITNSSVAEALGGLPPVKRHCSVLAKEALESAVSDFRRKEKN